MTTTGKQSDPPRLSVLHERLAVCRLEPREELPSWATKTAFFSVTRTRDELSVVCPEGNVPAGVEHDKGWCALKLEGPFDFSQVGMLVSVAAPMAEAGVSIFAVSTFDTDYVLVKEERLETAVSVLRDYGHEVRDAEVPIGGDIIYRQATEEDEPFLWEMLADAAHEDSVRTVAANPGTARYVEGWGRGGDLGFVAVAPGSGEPLGAAWLRLLVGENRGYGYVDDRTPEIAVAVRPAARGTGIGASLISRLLQAARARYRAVCLSVRADNPARRLYERLGFEVVEGGEKANRTGGTSVTMRLDLTGAGPAGAPTRGPSVSVRQATGEDEEFLWQMLYEAVHWGSEESGPKPPPDELLSDPVLARYLAGWGRRGDLGVIALDADGERPIGAAWSRLFTEGEPVYGFVDAATPEIAIAVAPEVRGRGVGGALLDALMDAARSHGFDAVSLSVQRSNPVAVRLYEKHGFVRLREEDDAWVMKADLGREARSR